MITLALYKGTGDWTDKAIRLYTRSKYSHCELIINGLWCSISPRTLIVTTRCITPKDNHWDFIDIPCSEQRKRVVFDFFMQECGKKYDWTGILFSQFLPLSVQNPDRWFCSEICSQALININKLPYNKPAQWYSPERLYRVALGIGHFRN